MKTINEQGAQGDILIRRITSIPDGVTKVERSKEGHIVAHSETGHHHVIPEELVCHFAGPDPLVSFLDVPDSGASIVHLRSFDTHETIHLTGGCFEVRRQREHTPEGWRQVAD